ncbi:MAG: diguanylate cyclase [Anaerolineales bacterium]
MNNLSALISFLALLFYFVLLLIILRNDIRNKLNRSFSLYLISMIIWSFSSFMIFLDSRFGTTLFWNRFMLIGSMLMPVAFFGFAQDFLMKDRWKWLFLGYISYLIIQIANFGGYIIEEAYLQDGLLYNQYALVGMVISGIYWVLFVGFLGFELFQEYRKAEDGFYRNRIKYLLVVTVITFTGSLTNLTDLKVFPVDIAFNALSALLISYAILRHRLIEIKVVVRKGLWYSIPTIIIGAGYFLVISLVVSVFHSTSNVSLFIISLLIAVMTAVIAQPIRDKAQHWIDKYFFREKYDSRLMLQRVSNSTASELDLVKLTNLILKEIVSTLHIERSAFFLKRDGDRDFKVVSHKGMDGQVQIKLRAGHPLITWFENGNPLLTKSDVGVLPHFKALWEHEQQDLEKMGIELFIPLRVGTDLVGVLVIGPKLSQEPYTKDDELTLMTLANQTAVAIENARLFYEVQQLAIIDDLTGIFNRRYLLELSDREFRRAQRFGRNLSLVMMDIDHFKQVNDTFGHAVGDEVLKALAERCQHNIRNVDVLGRYGGEEFVILLPETLLSEAMQITERLCTQISEYPIETSIGQVNLTASFGIACYSPDVKDLYVLLRNADIALYSAKRNGRNRFYAFSAELKKIS